ncbi:lipid IV(A) 3-deoxy-D-manno-octulosonic acid transferase [Psychromonas sp. Urea-02u-13]|uniref:lipid IV(A) 3-deoxy-D-manno-octulosonic acid transferase n=1 Tax=Psychromonas sp. Urea-02u-13 TaxID=2058326 RepID=UPI000C3216B6|nr:lipid IV(A) 3-deoxy-D-manno-octulosonic acid transferase [Psychromonas sp. Urea-02u-13]PKG37742.1 3-deoxy-D-manno-octulosonic acid transferase [Psychromonas sp. Urea-02u-13]
MLIRLIYTTLLALLSPILLFSLYKKKPHKPAFGSRWKEHFGYTPTLEKNEQPLWIHAVSVGEAIAATPLIKALKEQNPSQPIVVTTTTSTGAEQIAKLGDLVDHRYMPIDFSFAVNGFLKAVKPSKLLIIETELWPNTLHSVGKANIPIYVVNARLSEKSCQGYAKVQPLFTGLSKHLTKVLCQTQADADRFERLGINKERLYVTGSIKFDIKISDNIKQQGTGLRNLLGNERPVWIAASTHEGEDQQVLDAHQEILKVHPTALLILVPRHPERFDNMFELTKRSGFNCIRRTSNENITEDAQVYLGDTMGEMLVLMGAADVCFMGGSLLGDKVGGHNVLEPAALGVPVVIGPSYYNFKGIVEELLLEQGILVCKHKEIHNTVSQLITNKNNCSAIKLAAQTVVQCNQGSLKRTITLSQ